MFDLGLVKLGDLDSNQERWNQNPLFCQLNYLPIADLYHSMSNIRFQDSVIVMITNLLQAVCVVWIRLYPISPLTQKLAARLFALLQRRVMFQILDHF